MKINKIMTYASFPKDIMASFNPEVFVAELGAHGSKFAGAPASAIEKNLGESRGRSGYSVAILKDAVTRAYGVSKMSETPLKDPDGKVPSVKSNIIDAVLRVWLSSGYGGGYSSSYGAAAAAPAFGAGRGFGAAAAAAPSFGAAPAFGASRGFGSTATSPGPSSQIPVVYSRDIAYAATQRKLIEGTLLVKPKQGFGSAVPGTVTITPDNEWSLGSMLGKHPTQYNGVEYASIEHAYQCARYAYYKDNEHYRDLANNLIDFIKFADEPRKARILGSLKLPENFADEVLNVEAAKKAAEEAAAAGQPEPESPTIGAAVQHFVASGLIPDPSFDEQETTPEGIVKEHPRKKQVLFSIIKAARCSSTESQFWKKLKGLGFGRIQSFVNEDPGDSYFGTGLDGKGKNALGDIIKACYINATKNN